MTLTCIIIWPGVEMEGPQFPDKDDAAFITRTNLNMDIGDRKVVWNVSTYVGTSMSPSRSTFCLNEPRPYSKVNSTNLLEERLNGFLLIFISS